MSDILECSEEEYFGESAEYWQQERLPDAPANIQQQVQADSDKPNSLT